MITSSAAILIVRMIFPPPGIMVSPLTVAYCARLLSLTFPVAVKWDALLRLVCCLARSYFVKLKPSLNI